MRFWPWIRPPKPAQGDGSYARYDAYSKLLDRNGRWIEVADTKAAVIIGVLIATFPALLVPAFPALRKLMSAVPPTPGFWACVPPVVFLVLTVAVAINALYTLICLLMVLKPRLTREWKAGLVFYGDVAKLKYEEWQWRVAALDPEALACEVLEQVYATACIADIKHKYVQRAIGGMLGVILLGLALYVFSQFIR